MDATTSSRPKNRSPSSGSERHQPAIGAGVGARRDRQPGRDERPRRRPSALRVQHLGEADLRRQPTVDRLGGRVVDQDLSPIGQLQEPGRRRLPTLPGSSRPGAPPPP